MKLRFLCKRLSIPESAVLPFVTTAVLLRNRHSHRTLREEVKNKGDGLQTTLLVPIIPVPSLECAKNVECHRVSRQARVNICSESTY